MLKESCSQQKLTVVFLANQSRSYVPHSRTCRSDRRVVETREKERKKKTARQCRQLKKRRNSWSVSDIIVVVGVSGMGREKGKKEDATRRTRRKAARRSHMHHDGDDDTIWSFAPEACDNITATCYVLHGRRHAWGTAYAYEENATTTGTSGTPAGVCIRAEVKGWVDGLVGCAYTGRRLRKRMAAAYPEVADRRALGRIFCTWICRICQISQTMPPTILSLPDCYQQHSGLPRLLAFPALRTREERIPGIF